MEEVILERDPADIRNILAIARALERDGHLTLVQPATILTFRAPA
jgi:hypothetical protein